jgi:hypothetical protein
MSPAALDDLVVQSDTVLSAATDDEVLAMDEASGACFSMGGSGMAIWAAAKAPIAVRDLCAVLMRRYRIDAAECERQTLAYVGQLLDEGLLRLVSPQTGG